MIFTEKLNQLRREKGLSQEQLAEKLHVSRQAVSKWETGEAQPDMSKLLLMCDVFNVSMDELCGRQAVPNVEKQEAPSRRSLFNWLCAVLLAAGLLIGLAGGYFGQVVFRDKADQTASQSTAEQTTSQDTIDNDQIFDNLNITNFSFYTVYTNDSSRRLRIVFSPSISNDAMKYEVVKTDNEGNTTRYNAEYSGGVCQCTFNADYPPFTLSVVISDGKNIYTAALVKFDHVDENGFGYQELRNE